MKSVLSSLLFLALFIWVAKGQSPDTCFNNHSSSSLDSFVKCWRGFIAKEGSLSDEDWTTSLPTDQQLIDWKDVIGRMLSSDGTCDTIQIPQTIGDFYAVKLLTDKSSHSTFCILYERTSKGDRFLKGWGLFVTPYTRTWTRYNLHYSVAHPRGDGPVDVQAANVFSRTYGRSLMITGVERRASRVESECQANQSRSDGAHDSRTMFHEGMIAIYNWQFQSSQVGKCNASNCAFVQFHGKDASSCANDTVVLSTGYPSQAPIYRDQSTPVNRIKSAWRRIAPSNWAMRLPDETACDLIGGSNIFGRVLNGVQQGQECKMASASGSASGLFVHAEQAIEARESGAYDTWTKVIVAAFGQ